MSTKLNRKRLEEIAKLKGWKRVPEQMHLNADAIECICSQCGDGVKSTAILRRVFCGLERC